MSTAPQPTGHVFETSECDDHSEAQLIFIRFIRQPFSGSSICTRTVLDPLDADKADPGLNVQKLFTGKESEERLQGWGSMMHLESSPGVAKRRQEGAAATSSCGTSERPAGPGRGGILCPTDRSLHFEGEGGKVGFHVGKRPLVAVCAM